MLKKRLMTAAIFITVVIYILSFSPVYLYHLLFVSLLMVVIFLSGTEFAALRWNILDGSVLQEQSKPTLKPKHFLVGFSYAFLVLLFYYLFYIQTKITYEKSFSIMMAWVFFCLFSAIGFIYRKAIDMHVASNKLLNILSGFIYLSVPGICLIQLALMHFEGIHRSAQLYFCLATIFMGDTGAYFIGVRFGKHKLFPRISPKKSTEGAIGGLIFSMMTAFALNIFFDLPFSWWFSILVGISIGMAGQIGDLMESAFKRAGGFKDSGDLLPGHGGVLDRIDSVILGIPITYILFSLYQ
jgi:CDP-diglyceride synthetase